MNRIEITIKGDQGAGKTALHEMFQKFLQDYFFETIEYKKDEKGVYVGDINTQPTLITVTEQQTSLVVRLKHSPNGALLPTVDNLVLLLKNLKELKGLSDAREISKFLINERYVNFRLIDIEYALAYVEKQKCS